MKENFTFVLLLFTHNLRNCIQNFIMATAAACRTMCYFLNIFKSFFYILKFRFAMKCIFNICIGNLFAITNSVVFHDISPSNLSEISLEHTLKAFAVARFVLKPHFKSARRYCVSAVFLTVDFIISHGFPT